MRIDGYGWLTRLLVAVLVSVSAVAFMSATASAKVIHSVEGSFRGEGLPTGPLGANLSSVAVDDSAGPSNGDVYVLETNAGKGAQQVVDKFTAEGGYADVQITGSETAPGSFKFAATGSGVAVDSSLSLNGGDVYVADTGHHVVDRFSEDGVFICQITSSTTEAKTPGSECDAAGSGLSGAMTPAGLTVDSSGDLYVANDKGATIDVFGPDGHLIRSIGRKEGHLPSEMGSIALDSSGDLYVTNFTGGMLELNENGEFQRELASVALGVAIDRASSPNQIYVDEGSILAEYEPSGALRSDTSLAAGKEDFLGLDVNQATGRIYAAEQVVQGESLGVEIVGPDVVLPAVASEAATDVQTVSATLNGLVEPDLVHGGGDVLSCEFEYVGEQSFQEHPGDRYEGAASAPCQAVVPLPYSEPEHVSATVALTPSTTYHYRVVAADADGANDGAGEPEPEATLTTIGPPTIEQESANATTTNATLNAQVDPHGFATSCQAQYVDASHFNATGYEDATTLPCTPEALGSGTSEEPVSAAVSGLSVGTTYHYRFVASNEAGSTPGADETFAPFGLQSFALEALDAEGHPFTQAGGHPYVLRTSFAFNHTGEAEASVKDVETQLPAGLIGNPTAAAKCTREQLTDFQCPGAAQVGVLTLLLSRGSFVGEPVYNLVPPPGVPAEFGTRFNTFTNIYIDSNVRAGRDYGVTARVSNASAVAGVIGSIVELWGVPAAASHDAQRACPPPPGFTKEGGPCSAGTTPVPFLRMPTSCAGPSSASLSVDAWQDPGAFVSRTASMPAVTGCEQLGVSPSLSLSSSNTEAASPTGVGVTVKVPQDEEPGELATSDLKDTTVSFPPGVQVSPSAANGLGACSEAQAGYEGRAASGMALFSDAAVSCPDSSKLGTVQIKTPLLSEELQGALYLAEPAPNGEAGRNPFSSLVAVYLVAEDPALGVLVKLAGEGRLDPATGQLTTTFLETPQLPFEELHVDLFGGQRASLSTPPVCGSPATVSVFDGWSGALVGPLSEPSFDVISGVGGGPCPSLPLPFSPSFLAQSASTQAGGFSPFQLEIARPDGEQALTGVSVQLPPGVAALLSTVTPCAEPPPGAEWTCGEASLIGHSTAWSGLGSEPVMLGGDVYLTTGYDGAPFGLLVRTLAAAGPFDLGYVNVRSQITVDPYTAQVTVSTDPGPHGDALPTMLKGIPAQLKDLQVSIDRPGFEFNPTSCDPMSVNGTLTGAEGGGAAVSSRFQVGGCGSLPFHPALTATAGGRGSKANGTSVDVKITSAGVGQANIEKVELQFPLALSSRLATLNQACTEAAFNANPTSCPEGSVIGNATVHTPILNGPLAGPAYLVSHGGAAFPDVEFILQGEGIKIVLDGKTDIKNGITYSRFESAPDAPFTSFETELPAGPHGIFTANVPESENWSLCKAILTMPTTIVAQDGAVIEQNTNIAPTGCGAVLANKTKKLTNAQRLAKAVAACKKKYHTKKAKNKRTQCEKQARKRYAPKPKQAAHKAKRSNSHDRPGA